MTVRIEKMLFKDYQAIDGINSSKLKDFFSDRKLFYKTYISKKVPKKAEERHFIVGRAIHCKVLEPEVFDDNFLVGEHRQSTIVGKNNLTKCMADGKSLISEAEHDLCKAIALELPNQNAWCDQLAGAKDIYIEHVITVRIGNITLKAMLDKVVVHDDVVYIDDVKSSAESSSDEMAKAIADYDYLLQAAFYTIVAGYLFPDNKIVFRFVFCSKEEPYNMAFIHLTEEQQDLGFAVVNKLINDYVEAERTGVWYPEQVQEQVAEISKWKMSKYYKFLGVEL